MSSFLTTETAPSHQDLQSWNQSILSFDLDEIEAVATDRKSVDQQIGKSLEALFGDIPTIGYDPCTEFHCSAYGW